jgi:Transposase DDE domain
LKLVQQDGADFIVRTGWNSLRLKRTEGGEFDLFATLRAQAGQEGEVRVRVDDASLQLRLIIWRKTPEQAQAEQKRLLQNAKKRGTKVDPRSLEAAQYVMLVTSLPADVFPACDVLAIYRFRWQIELAFKRMKSLAGLDELAAREPALAQAWIYARLITFLIAEQIAGQVPDSPPFGPSKSHIKQTPHAKPLALAHDQNDPYGNPRDHSRPAVARYSRRSQASTSAPT